MGHFPGFAHSLATLQRPTFEPQRLEVPPASPPAPRPHLTPFRVPLKLPPQCSHARIHTICGAARRPAGDRNGAGAGTAPQCQCLMPAHQICGLFWAASCADLPTRTVAPRAVRRGARWSKMAAAAWLTGRWQRRSPASQATGRRGRRRVLPLHPPLHPLHLLRIPPLCE